MFVNNDDMHRLVNYLMHTVSGPLAHGFTDLAMDRRLRGDPNFGKDITLHLDKSLHRVADDFLLLDRLPTGTPATSLFTISGKWTSAQKLWLTTPLAIVWLLYMCSITRKSARTDGIAIKCVDKTVLEEVYIPTLKTVSELLATSIPKADLALALDPAPQQQQQQQQQQQEEREEKEEPDSDAMVDVSPASTPPAVPAANAPAPAQAPAAPAARVPHLAGDIAVNAVHAINQLGRDNATNYTSHAIMHIIEAILGNGSVYNTWMFAFERYNKMLKALARHGRRHTLLTVMLAMLRIHHVKIREHALLGPPPAAFNMWDRRQLKLGSEVNFFDRRRSPVARLPFRRIDLAKQPIIVSSPSLFCSPPVQEDRNQSLLQLIREHVELEHKELLTDANARGRKLSTNVYTYDRVYIDGIPFTTWERYPSRRRDDSGAVVKFAKKAGQAPPVTMFVSLLIIFQYRLYDELIVGDDEGVNNPVLDLAAACLYRRFNPNTKRREQEYHDLLNEPIVKLAPHYPTVTNPNQKNKTKSIISTKAQTSLAVYNLENVQPMPLCLVTPEMVPCLKDIPDGRPLASNERLAVRQPAADKIIYNEDDVDEEEEVEE
jgi:hypothetical protein